MPASLSTSAPVLGEIVKKYWNFEQSSINSFNNLKFYYLKCPTAVLVAEYQGETGLNGFSRGLEHVAALEGKHETSPL